MLSAEDAGCVTRRLYYSTDIGAVNQRRGCWLANRLRLFLMNCAWLSPMWQFHYLGHPFARIAADGHVRLAGSKKDDFTISGRLVLVRFAAAR